MDREGGDITAADMVNPVVEPSKIQRCFAGCTVFVTGGTGFLGRLLIEKLLRACDDLKRIYILVRPKKGKDCKQRFHEYFDDPLYDRLKRERPRAMEKVYIMEGDCALPELGLNNLDREKIISEVKWIFHFAATVRFDQKLRTATYINVRGTRDILQLAKSVQDLKSIVYVSTAFSFCPRRKIEEVFYEPTITADKLLTLVETLNDDKLEKIVPTIIGEWPNTYVFTKSVAEDVVRNESAGLPIAIVRPSIVVATVNDPIAGWIDNFYGPTGIFTGISIGLIRTFLCESSCISDLVPADYVVNCTIAAAWDIANIKGLHLNSEAFESNNEQLKSDIPIYNYVSGPQKPITWGGCNFLGRRHVQSIPSTLEVWHRMVILTSNPYLHLVLNFLLHLLPAYIVDFLALSIGKKPQLVKAYKKIDGLLNAVGYFCTQQWFFRNENTQNLWNKLNDEDKRIFEFDMGALDWDLFFQTYCRGGRVHLLKDPLDTIPQGYARRFKLKIAHYTLCTVLLLGILKLAMFLWNVIF